MVNTESLYSGADYGLMPKEYGSSSGYPIHASQLGLATDARTANQIQEVQKKLRTGTKVIEVSPSIDPTTFDYIPKEHFKEINRLKKLAGVDLTLHGPMIEPSGFNPRGGGGWDESQRKQAENQLFQSVVRGHELDPKGNVVITFHSAYGVPETEPTIKDGEEIKKTGTYVINEEAGRISFIPLEKNQLLGKELTTDESIKDYNKRSWSDTLEKVNNELMYAKRFTEEVTGEVNQAEVDMFDLKKKNQEEYENVLKFSDKFTPQNAQIIRQKVERLEAAEISVKDAYNRLTDLFNLAYKNAEKLDLKEDIKKLDMYRSKVKESIDKNKDDPLMFKEFREQVTEGLVTLSKISTPTILKSLKQFALDKGAETYGNVAYKSYQKFKDSAPIISIENPPYGQSGLASGEDLREMVKLSREKFVKAAMEDGKMSKSQAEEQAKKLIGATWDVGHINMLRKYGYEEKDIVEETKKIAPYVKHVHLSDNFGMEHTELPMGMGNVPYQKMLEAIGKFNKQVKKISETGGWYQFFKKEPLAEQLEALGSPIYTTPVSPSWSQAKGMMASYFSGLGNFLPDQHFATYGSGFTQVPADLGGQQTGNQSRFAGTQIE